MRITGLNDKTRLSAGSGLMLEKLLDAVNRSPAFEGFVTARLPVDNLRNDSDKRIEIECERGFVLEHDFNDAVIG